MVINKLWGKRHIPTKDPVFKIIAIIIWGEI